LLWGDMLCKCFQIRWAVCKENITNGHRRTRTLRN
jgi:hypothetical protein